MGAASSTSANGVLSPRTMKRQLSKYALTSAEQVSVVKSPEVLYDNGAELTDEEGRRETGFSDHTPVSPYALSWATTPSTATSFQCDADALKVLSGKEEDSITVSGWSLSRALSSSPTPELMLSLSPEADLGDGFFPPTPRGCHTPRSRTGTICTPTDVRRLSATQNLEMDLQDSPKGVRLSRRGGMCAFHENQVPESIRSIRTQSLFDIGGELCPEGERPTSHRRFQSLQFSSTPRAVESISSEVLSPPKRSLRRSRTDYLNSTSSRNSRRSMAFSSRNTLANIGGSQIP